MSLVTDYFVKSMKYKEEYGDNTIVLMQVGAFFEVYGKQHPITKEVSGSEIMQFSQICDLNVVEKKAHVHDMEVVMAGFKDICIDKYVKRLQDAGFTAVVYTQNEQVKDKDTTRSLYAIYSPGTYFNDDATKITNNIMCVWLNVIESSSLFDKITVKNGNNNHHPTKTIIIGVSIIDIYTGVPSMFEFREAYIKNPTTFDQLERIVSIHNPSETILIGNISLNEIDDIVSYANIQSQPIHKLSLLANNTTSAASSINSSTNKNQFDKATNCEKQTYQKAVLEKYYAKIDFNNFMFNFYENAIATQSFCYLLDFIYQHNPNLVNKMREPVFENYGDRLILANHSLKQLNIIDDHNYTGKYSSISKMLNFACTAMGKRKFAHNLFAPTTNVEYLQGEYDITEHILINSFASLQQTSLQKISLQKTSLQQTSYDHVKGLLSEIKDIPKWMRQIIMQKITPRSLYQLNNTIQTIEKLHSKIIMDDTIVKYLNKQNIFMPKIAANCEAIIQFIKHNLNLELCDSIESIQNFENNFINRTINDELDNKTQILMESNDKLVACQLYFNDLLRKCEKNNKNTEFVKIHETEKNNFTLVATKRRCIMLKSVLPTAQLSSVVLTYKSSFNGNQCSFDFANSQSYISMVESTSANDSITNTQIKEMCKNVTCIKLQLKDIVRSVFLTIIEKMSLFLPQMEEIAEYVAIIDVIYAKAYVAQKYNYCKPSISNENRSNENRSNENRRATTATGDNKSFVNVTDLRHCLIERLNQEELYVTNDICLGKSVDGVLLYGTNAVGKTSFIRALGISIIMAQSGLYVPASSFVFKPYKYLFTRIIGNDNIFKGLSTFAVEMSELRTILKLADENSLILGDELCSGTESISAVSIFVAGIQNMAAKQSSFIFATHLHEIVNYEEIVNLQSVALKHMEVIYDKERDLLIYDRKLKDGPGQNMYGLEVCKSLSLPDDFLTAAYNIRLKYHPECAGALSGKTSHFNSKKIKSALCENCGKEAGAEVHHLQHQQEANKQNGIISQNGMTFHKNHNANLITVCEKCHDAFHKIDKQHKKVKTSNGIMLIEI